MDPEKVGASLSGRCWEALGGFVRDNEEVLEVEGCVAVVDSEGPVEEVLRVGQLL